MVIEGPQDVAGALGALAVPVLTGSDAAGYAIDGRRPAAVVQPRDADEVAAVLRLAAAHTWSVVPRGGGTAIEQGNPPARLDLVLDLSRLDRVLEHRPRDLTVTVEAGITLAALQATLAMHGQMLALDPPRADRATIGGILAANSWGPRRQRYGTARDLLIGSRTVLADGTRVRSGGKVVKNVAGYDLNKLFIGSAGTLAVIVEATFKLTPIPAAFGMLVAAFPSVEAAHTVALAVTTSRLHPLTLDLIGPEAARRLVPSRTAGATEDGWLLVAELGGDPAAVERTARELALMATEGGAAAVTALQDDERETMMQWLRDFGRSPKDPAAVIVRAAVLPSQVVEAVRALERAAGAKAPAAVIVRAGSGVVYGYWDEPVTGAAAIVHDLRARIGRLGGTVVVERAPPAAKAGLDVWGIDGADVALMRRVKEAYDPAGLLSPGRLF